jgi:hypothetical protein
VDDLGVVLALAESGPGEAHGARERSLTRGRAGPDGVQDLVLGHGPIAVLEQKEQQV